MRIFCLRQISQLYIREKSPTFLVRNMFIHRMHQVNAMYICCCFKFSKHPMAEFPHVTNPLPAAIYTHAVIHAPVIYLLRSGLHGPGKSYFDKTRFHMATILKNDGANYFRQMKKSCAKFIFLAPLAPMAIASGNPENRSSLVGVRHREKIRFLFLPQCIIPGAVYTKSRT